MDNFGRQVLAPAIFFFLLLSSNAQTLEILWTAEASDSVLASVEIVDDVAFVGDTGGVFHAIDTKNGKVKWSYETGGNIQAKALVVGNNIFFESANVFYLLKRSNGELIWKMDPEMEPESFTYQDKTYSYKFDPYDDKRSTAFLADNIIYVGGSNGKVYCLNAADGKVSKTFDSKENSPIRSSPLVARGKLFFGDWNGVVYCIDLSTDEVIWEKKTYRGHRPYPTFGGVVSEFVIHNDLLIFGARNHTLNVLYAETGEKEWTYTDPRGGWIIGDPVIKKDTLYMGGSDNFTMYAFHPKYGIPLWSFNGEKNIYTKPILTDDWLLYTGGNGYNWRDTGKLFLLDRRTGSKLSDLELPNGVFSSPAMIDNTVIFGCYDKKVYGVRIKP